MASKRFRALNKDFREFLDSHSWPYGDQVKDYIKTHFGGSDNNFYKQLQNGGVVAEKYCRGFIELLLLGCREGEIRVNGANSFRGYLASLGMDALTVSTDEAIERLCGPVYDHRISKEGWTDVLAEGLLMIGHIFSLGINNRRFVQGIRPGADEALLRDSIRWMMTFVGREIPGKGERLSPAEAIAHAEGYMKVTLADYQDRAVAWHAANPWTVVLARGKPKPVGMTIVLPISNEMYDDIVEGRKRSYDTTPQDFRWRSNTVLMENASERPTDLGGSMSNPTTALSACLLTQLGVLWSYRRGELAPPLRILSFAGTPANRKRLVNAGFHSLGCKMKDTGVELMELSLDDTTIAGQGFHVVIRTLGANVDGLPLP